LSDFFAKVYVDTSLEHDRLLQVTADAVFGTVDDWTILADGVEIDVRPNDDFRSAYCTIDPDDFLYFPFALDVESVTEAITIDSFIALLSEVMNRLHVRGMRVVVACDWEGRLPGSGRLGFA